MLSLSLSLSSYLGNGTTGRNERSWNANRSDLSLRVIRERRCGCIQKFAYGPRYGHDTGPWLSRGYRLVRGGIESVNEINARVAISWL